MRNLLTKYKRRFLAMVLCISFVLTSFPQMIRAEEEAQGFQVDFAAWDTGTLDGDGYHLTNVPQGAKLYRGRELVEAGVVLPGFQDVNMQDNDPALSKWYLYKEGFGPVTIPDAPVRDGYEFIDWVSASGTEDEAYTVTGDTTFVAHYENAKRYVLNLYFHFSDASHTTAAETMTEVFAKGETIRITLPNTDAVQGLVPHIEASQADGASDATALSQLIGNGQFSGSLDDAFLEHCVQAGFLEKQDGNYVEDENGLVQINIPLVYTIDTSVDYRVRFYKQQADHPEQYDLDQEIAAATSGGTTIVSLEQSGLLNTYEGFHISERSVADSESTEIKPDGSSIISIYYDRNLYTLQYDTNGGNLKDPVQLRYGQSIDASMEEDGIRPGYQFQSWTWMNAERQIIPRPSVMPMEDLILSANWEGESASFQIVYWLENANDNGYTVAGSYTLSGKSGTQVGLYDGRGERPYYDIAAWISENSMQTAGISDAQYFTFVSADANSSNGTLKTIAGDGSTVINLKYSRNKYRLIFHLGRSNAGRYQVSTSTSLNVSGNMNDWQGNSTFGNYDTVTRFDGSSVRGVSPQLVVNGQVYSISNNTEDCYQIYAKYDADISALWPVATDDTVESVKSGSTIYRLFTWATHIGTGYYANHSNKNIIGLYTKMSSELIPDAHNPEIAHHLLAYWSSATSSKTHHYLIENLTGTGSFNGSSFASYSRVNNMPSGGLSQIREKTFDEMKTIRVRTSAEPWMQAAPAYDSLQLQYGCYQYASSNDVYFFYTYKNYSIKYYENNQNLHEGTEDSIRTGAYHLVADGDRRLIRSLELAGISDYQYTPTRAYVSSYGNAYEFGGWYMDPECTIPMNFEEAIPNQTLILYAKWIPPTVSVRLTVTDGRLTDDSLQKLQDKGYSVSSTTVSQSGKEITTYVVGGVPIELRADLFVDGQLTAVNRYGLLFKNWTYTSGGQTYPYPFNSGQAISSDLTLNAQFQTAYSGVYAVRYLTKTPQSNQLPVVQIGDETYYRIREDQVFSGIIAGADITKETTALNGYLPLNGSITKTVLPPDEAGNIQTYFDFTYQKAEGGTLEYYVHYILYDGNDYGRTAPPQSVTKIAQDQKVTLHLSELQSPVVTAYAKVISGYTPKIGWSKQLLLSASSSENHIYFYYLRNSTRVPYEVVYYFEDTNGAFTDSLKVSGTDQYGKVLTAKSLVYQYNDYIKDSALRLEFEKKLKGHSINEVFTAPVLILANEQTVSRNRYVIFLKNNTYHMTYVLNDTEDPSTWDGRPESLIQVQDTYVENVKYPNGATLPVSMPVRFSYQLLGWNTKEDGSGTFYPLDQLKNAAFYQSGQMLDDQTLYAVWEKKKAVTFNLGEGVWTDDRDALFRNESGAWTGYVPRGSNITQPADPYRQGYAFLGWSKKDPAEFTVNGSVDRQRFEQNRFSFTSPIEADTVLYAVWEAQVPETVSLFKTDPYENRLENAVFSIKRIQSRIQQNGEFIPLRDSNGNLKEDSGIYSRQLTTDANGVAFAEDLLPGLYVVREDSAPDGYTKYPDDIILSVPSGEDPYLLDPESSSYVKGDMTDGHYQITVKNIPQYSVSIQAPDALSFQYRVRYIWNPETMTYEEIPGTGSWTPEGSSVVTVTNTSSAANRILVFARLNYETGYSRLLNLSGIVVETTDGSSFVSYDSSGQTEGSLKKNESATFSLSLTGEAGMSLKEQYETAGHLTIAIRKP